MTDQTLIWRDGEVWKRAGAGPWRKLPPAAPLDSYDWEVRAPDSITATAPPPVDLSDLF